MNLCQRLHLRILLGASIAIVPFLSAHSVQAQGARPSAWVYPSNVEGANLLYAMDTNGVRLNDFSECGYKRGQVELPNVTNLVDQSRWLYLHPIGGGAEDGPGINAALNFVGAFPVNSNGLRGVVCLGPGEFVITATNPIVMTKDGVVLKGSGSTPSTGTLLRGETLTVYTLVTIQGNTNSEPVLDPNAIAYMTELLIPAGTRTFRVNTTLGFSVGQSVQITHTATADWIHDLDMDRLNRDWMPADQASGVFERVIQRIEGDWITVDTPIPQTFLAQYSYGKIQAFTWAGRVQNCGVEDLFCYSNFRPTSPPFQTFDPFHAGTAVRFVKAENAWARNVRAQYFGKFTFQADEQSKFVTMAECQNLFPVSPISGGYRYSFHLDHDAQYVLVRDCLATEARHDFVLSGLVPGPNAFVRCASENSHEASGPHERWSTGALFDNVAEHGNEMQASNLGNGGGGSSAHGWAGAFMVFWNCYSEGDFRVRNPPTALNWLIGSDGGLLRSKRGCWPYLTEGGDCWAVGADPAGTYDQSGDGSPPVQLHSLYYAQLQQRLLYPGSKFREYRLGDIDQLAFTPALDDHIPVAPAWLAEVQLLSGSDPVTSRFDSFGSNQWTAVTFNVPAVPGEQIVAASLSLGLHISQKTAEHDFYLETVDIRHSFTNLGWTVATNGTSTHTIPINPSAFLDNKLNLAFSPDCGVDFAVLNLQVAPITATTTQTLSAVDTYVNGGDKAGQNFAAEAELLVKADGNDDVKRRAFLDWNLREVKGTVLDAKVRLYCTYCVQSGNEQLAAVVPSSDWSPNSITWNTQPATSPAFAYWIPQGPGYYSEFTVTPQVAAVLASEDRHLRVCVDSAGDWGGHGDVAYASSEDPDFAHRPQLILRFSNSLPTIAGPASQFMPLGVMSGPLPVTIGDAETPASLLTLTATSSRQNVVNDFNILLGGSGSNRMVMFQPSQVGKTLITLRVTDGMLTSSTAFAVSVGFGNSFPAISVITNRVMAENTILSVPFTVSDVANVPNDLTLTVSNSNPELFPTGSVELLPPPDFSGNRTLVLTPASNRWGTNLVTIHVDNGFLATDGTFLVSVTPVEQPPQYAQIISPLSGHNALPGVPIPIVIQAFDFDSNLAGVEVFHQGANVGHLNQSLGTSSNAPYSVTWTNPAAGIYTLYAIAYDRAGLAVTSPPVTLNVAIPLVPQPTLLIVPATNNVAIVWSTSLSNDALQSTTNLTTPVLWTPVVATPVEDEQSSSWIYFLAPTEPKLFFRLAQ